MKSFRFKVLVSALRAAGVVTDRRSYVEVVDRHASLWGYGLPSDAIEACTRQVRDIPLGGFDVSDAGCCELRLWQTLGRLQGERKPQLPRLVVDGLDFGEVVDFSMVLAPDLRVQKYPFFVDTAVL